MNKPDSRVPLKRMEFIKFFIEKVSWIKKTTTQINSNSSTFNGVYRPNV